MYQRLSWKNKLIFVSTCFGAMALSVSMLAIAGKPSSPPSNSTAVTIARIPKNLPVDTDYPEDSKPRSAADRFVVSLVSRAKTIPARKAILEIGYQIYEQRSRFMDDRIHFADGENDAGLMLSASLLATANKYGYQWSYETRQDMAIAIVSGLYQWRHEHQSEFSDSMSLTFKPVEVNPIDLARGRR